MMGIEYRPDCPLVSAGTAHCAESDCMRSAPFVHGKLDTKDREYLEDHDRHHVPPPRRGLLRRMIERL